MANKMRTRNSSPRTKNWKRSLKQVLLLLKEQDRHISINQVTTEINISPDMFYNSKTIEWDMVRTVLKLSNEILQEIKMSKKRQYTMRKKQFDVATNKIFNKFLRDIQQ